MNKTTLGIALTAILAFSILFAFLFVQGYFSASPTITMALSGVKNDLQLFMSLDANKTTFEQGENIGITLELTYISNQTKSITDVNGISIFNFEVYNRNNNWIYSYEIGAYPIINQTIIIPPNANYIETFTWGQGGIPYVHPSQEPAGTYYIIGNINDNGNIPSLQTSRLSISIRYSLLENTVVFLIVVIAVACIVIILLVHRSHQKTAN